MEKLELEDLIKFSKNMKVLYVDADPIHRQSAFDVFKIFFHEIDTAQNGLDGLEHFHQNKYNLIITDISMTKLNGIEMITKIREISKNITILVMSSDQDKIHFMNLIKLGIDGYILKPVQVKQFVSVIQKVIEKLQNKEELFEYKNNLEELVQKKTIEVTTLNNNLQKQIDIEVQKNMFKKKKLFEQSKMASLEELLQNISHQWRQPLSCITTGITGLHCQKELGTLKDEEFYKTCEAVNEHAQILSQTIDSFKNYMNNDKTKTKFILFDAVKTFLNLVSSTAKKHKIKIKLDIEKDLQIFGNKNELKQILIHLFNNSKEILSTLEIPRLVKISAYTQEKNIIITFSDNAGGIDSNIIEKVFEPYFTTKYKSQGIGLGLSSAYNIIKHNFHGTIEVENIDCLHKNKLFKGALFTITLPISQ